MGPGFNKAFGLQPECPLSLDQAGLAGSAFSLVPRFISLFGGRHMRRAGGHIAAAETPNSYCDSLGDLVSRTEAESRSLRNSERQSSAVRENDRA